MSNKPIQNRARSCNNSEKDIEELHRRRHAISVELRKAKTEELSKDFKIELEEIDLGNETETTGDDITKEWIMEAIKKLRLDLQPLKGNLLRSTEIETIKLDIHSGDPIKQLEATQKARTMLSGSGIQYIDAMIGAGIVPKCVEFLSPTGNLDLQFEAAWVLTNIASGNSEQTNIVVAGGAVEPLIKMLSSSHTHIAQQAIWALGNITGDGPALRDLAISKGIIVPLINLIHTHSTDMSFLKNVAWTLSNLCLGESPRPPKDAIHQCLPVLAELIRLPDLQVVAKACYGFSYLVHGNNDQIDAVINAGVVPWLVHLLDCENNNVVTLCLGVIGNIVSGNHIQTQAALDSNVIPALIKLLRSAKSDLVETATWIISNIGAGTTAQIQSLLLDNGIIPHLLHVLRTGEDRAQKQVCWTFTNISSNGSIHQNLYLTGQLQGVIPAICDMLGNDSKEGRTIVIGLDALENILNRACETMQSVRITNSIKLCGGLAKIKQLQSHEDQTVCDKANQFIKTWFSE